MWKMINETNAVEGVALTVRFREPVNSLIGRRVIAALETVSSAEGFIDKHPIQQIQIDMASQAVRQTSATGFAFQHMTIERNQFNEVGPFLSRQLVFQPEQLILQINKYRTWEKEWAGAQRVFKPALEILAPIVPIQALRLEYLNRFVFDGPPAATKLSGLLNQSEFIASLGSSTDNLWHSHSGRFEEQSQLTRRLVQINADMQDLTSNHPLNGNRTLALMLAVEQQFLNDDRELTVAMIDDYFVSLHDGIHTLFKKVVDSTFASSNGLPS